MRNVIGLVAFVISCMGGPLFAAEPPASSISKPSSASQTTNSAAETQTASSAASSANATSVVATVSGTDSKVKLVAGDDDAAAQLKRFKAAGYKPQVRNGEVVFCRKEQQLGSRFEVNTCSTAQQIEQQIQQAQDATLKAQRTLTQLPQH